MQNIQVILVQPDEDENIGAVCRAMQTMGLGRLTLVTERKIDINRVKTLALHAFGVFQSANYCTDLESAVQSSVLSAALTRRTGRRRKYISFTPEELADKLETYGTGEVSLVFGNEEHGLTERELAICDMAVHIPSSPEFPSLNLSHAVQIIGYVLAMKNKSNTLPRHSPPSRQELTASIDKITGSLREIGFFSFSGAEGKEDTARFLRDIFARAALSQGEMKRLTAIFSKCAGFTLRAKKQV